VEQEEQDLAYPLEEEDLKRRVAGEVLRTFEQEGEMPPVPETVAIIEEVCTRVGALMRRDNLPLRRIDIQEHLECCRQRRKVDP
jgi:hypothetical protein